MLPPIYVYNKVLSKVYFLGLVFSTLVRFKKQSIVANVPIWAWKHKDAMTRDSCLCKFYCESVCVCTVYGGRCRPASELALCVVLVLKALLPNLSLSLPPCLFLSFLFFPLAVCRKLGVKCLQLKQWQVCSAVRHRVIYLQSTLHFIYHWHTHTHTHTNTFYNSVHCFPALSPGDNERVRLP